MSLRSLPRRRLAASLLAEGRLDKVVSCPRYHRSISESCTEHGHLGAAPCELQPAGTAAAEPEEDDWAAPGRARGVPACIDTLLQYGLRGSRDALSGGKSDVLSHSFQGIGRTRQGPCSRAAGPRALPPLSQHPHRLSQHLHAVQPMGLEKVWGIKQDRGAWALPRAVAQLSAERWDWRGAQGGDRGGQGGQGGGGIVRLGTRGYSAKAGGEGKEGEAQGEGGAAQDGGAAAAGAATETEATAVVEEEEEGPKERLRKREKYGTYEDDIEDEIMETAWEIPDKEDGSPGLTHLYDARTMVDDWIHDPTFFGMLAAPPEESGAVDPQAEYAQQLFDEGDGAELRWETRLVLGPGANAWHPANRKVKVSVYVGDLGLTPLATQRMLGLVGWRYNKNKDELTIVSERYADREENRKDVLRTLYALIDEANRADELAAAAAAAGASAGASEAGESVPSRE